MKFHRAFALMVVCIGLVSLSVSSAQEANNCAAIVQAALQTVDELCSATARNQACYGNLTLEAEPQPNVTNLKFNAPGDIANVTNIRALRLSALDETSQEWGVSLLRLQANLPDTLPGQNVTMVLFGSVDIRPADAPSEASITVQAANTINVRGGPSTADKIVGSLPSGASATANGRNADGSWLRVRLQDNRFGWVSAQLVSSGDNLTLLTVVTVDEPFYRPMQAFYLKTGAGDSPCAEAPDSGVLVQTPSGAGKINFRINEISIQLGSTVYLQAQAGHVLRISVVEGQARVEALGETQTIPEGTQVEVPLDANLSASGPPSEPEPYAQADVLSLPLSLLPEVITVAEPLTEDQIADYLAKENACHVISSTNVNVRSGPGTHYALIDNIKIVNGQPRLQATGTDGIVWYGLGANLWVRSDLVDTTGDCASVPILPTLPPVPTAVVSEPTTIGLWTCTPSSPFPVKAGTVYLQMGYSNPEWETCEAAQAGIQGLPSFVGDGPAPFDYRFFGGCHVNTDHGGYGVDAEATVILEPGTYTYRGVWNNAGGPGSNADTPACTFTVVP